jgi:hypothetical protein
MEIKYIPSAKLTFAFRLPLVELPLAARTDIIR